MVANGSSKAVVVAGHLPLGCSISHRPVASVSLLALAILFLWVAIAVRSMAPEITAEGLAVTVHLAPPGPTADGDR